MSNRYQITRAAELKSLPAFRALIDSACREHRGIDDQTCYDLKLAVDEACTNIVTHGYAGMNPGSIILELELYAHQMVMTLTDFGHAFEPCEMPAPDLHAAMEGQPITGFGLFIIYQTMDHVDYETTEDGNRLTLVKRLLPIEEA